MSRKTLMQAPTSVDCFDTDYVESHLLFPGSHIECVKDGDNWRIIVKGRAAPRYPDEMLDEGFIEHLRGLGINRDAVYDAIGEVLWNEATYGLLRELQVR